MILVGWFGDLKAQDLIFPTTEKEIIEALSLKDGRTTFQSIEYISESGKVYKIIEGKRFRLRGLSSIVNSDIVPRAGAIIHFDFDSAQIKPESFILLNEFGKALTGALSNAEIQIEGHTDSIGTEQYNQALSKRRAESVRKYLMERFIIPSDHLVIIAYGESKPITSNETEKGCIKNRRVEFVRIQ